MINSSDAVNGRRGNLLKKIFYQGRHHKVSIILVSQKLKDIPLGMRINSTHIICFNLRNKNEEDAFLEENKADCQNRSGSSWNKRRQTKLLTEYQPHTKVCLTHTEPTRADKAPWRAF
jgi:hypothetical protein